MFYNIKNIDLGKITFIVQYKVVSRFSLFLVGNYLGKLSFIIPSQNFITLGNKKTPAVLS